LPPTFRSRPNRIPVALAALTAGALSLTTLAGCSDNISCVFTTGCGDPPPGALGGSPAKLPSNGQRIVDAPPAVTSVLPDAMDAHPTTPVVVVFSESMNDDTVLDGIDLFQEVGVFSDMVPTNKFLVADGRVLILLPEDDLVSGFYFVRVNTEDPITDLTGQALGRMDGDELGMFQVDDMADVPAEVLTTFPERAEDDASDTPEIVVVFDRTVNSATVNGQTIDVLVEGAAPVPDPAPSVVGGTSTVFTWRSQNSGGDLTSFGPSAAVEVTISPDAMPILDLDGDPVRERIVDFTTSEVSTPTLVEIESQPTDAVGIANLDRADPLAELMIRVDLVNGEVGDLVELFFFGLDPDDDPADLIALLRQTELTGAGPFPDATFDAATADLTFSVSPLEPRFADGTLAVAARTRRDGAVSPLRVLDTDPDLAGIQDALLDTRAPTILELFGADGETDLFSTDQRRLVLGGTADEVLRSVEVVSGIGDNGTLPPVVGSEDGGGFLAAPVPFDLGTPATTYTAIAYDVALNPSAPIMGAATQLGIVGPTAFAPGDPLTVEVFDAITLEPLVGALVVVHADDGTTSTLDQTSPTDGLGIATFLSAAPGALDALVTVDLAGYDLFTFHGVPAQRLSIPLRPTSVSSAASVLGQVRGADVAPLTLVIADTRRPESAGTFYDVGACTGAPAVCPHGPQFVVADRAGTQTLFGGEFQQTLGAYDPTGLLAAFELSVPRPPVATGEQDMADVAVDQLLRDGPTAERRVELPDVVLDGSGAVGVDFTMLDGDARFTGDARILVEATLPGLARPAPVGLALGFLQGGSMDTWDVRSVIPGDAQPLGGLGSVLDEVYLRLEARDDVGRSSTRRIDSDDLSPGLVVPLADVPDLVDPPPGGNSLATSYDVLITDTIPDGFAGTGFHRVQLTDSTGRGWSIWRLDGTGTQVRLRVPDPAPGTGLTDGAIALRAWAYAVPTAGAPVGFGPAAFLWSDLERLADSIQTSESFTYTQP